MPFRVIVTGASGFLGSHICEAAVRAGLEVTALIRESSSVKWLEGMGCLIRRADLFDREAMREVFEGAGAVIHNAGALWGDYRKVNRGGTESAVEGAIAAGVGRFVQISSIAAEGPSPVRVMREEDHGTPPLTQYGSSKREAEDLLRGRMNDIHITILRFPMIYGPRDTQVLKLFQLARYGVRLEVGVARRYISTVYAGDAAAAAVAAALGPQPSGRVYPISDGTPRSFGEISAAIVREYGRREIGIRIPAGVITGASGIMRAVGIDHTALNPEQFAMFKERFWLVGYRMAFRDLGWEPAVPLEEGVRRTMEWYRAAGWL